MSIGMRNLSTDCDDDWVAASINQYNPYNFSIHMWIKHLPAQLHIYNHVRRLSVTVVISDSYHL